MAEEPTPTPSPTPAPPAPTPTPTPAPAPAPAPTPAPAPAPTQGFSLDQLNNILDQREREKKKDEHITKLTQDVEDLKKSTKRKWSPFSPFNF